MNVVKLIQALDFLPGYKTILTCMFALGMILCTSLGYHQFSQEAWAAVGVSGAMFWRMGMDRPKGKKK